jgi:hypothetical protein
MQETYHIVVITIPILVTTRQRRINHEPACHGTVQASKSP